METQLLEAFVEVATRLHFSRAAEHLGVSQPALSHQIRRLEEHVGAPLLDRTSRQVALTDAGLALLPDARRMLVELDRAIAQSRGAAEGGAGHLVVGSIGAALNGVAPLIVQRLRDAVPGIAVQLTQMDTPEALSALRNRELDVAVVRSAEMTSGVRVETLFEERMMLALPAGHPLTEAGEVSVAQLRGERFVLWPRASSPTFHDQVYALCRAAGFKPDVAMEGTDIETQLGLVSAGTGISFQPESFMNLGRTGVRWARISGDAPRSPQQIAWCEPARTPLISTIVEIARQIGAERSGSPAR